MAERAVRARRTEQGAGHRMTVTVVDEAGRLVLSARERDQFPEPGDSRARPRRRPTPHLDRGAGRARAERRHVLGHGAACSRVRCCRAWRHPHRGQGARSSAGSAAAGGTGEQDQECSDAGSGHPGVMSRERSEEGVDDTRALATAVAPVLPGRALNQARTNHFVIESPSGRTRPCPRARPFWPACPRAGDLIEPTPASKGCRSGAPRSPSRACARWRAQPFRRGAHALRAHRSRPGAGGIAGGGVPSAMTALPHGRGRDHGQGQRAGEARVSGHHPPTGAAGGAAKSEPFTRALERMNRFQEPEAHTLVADLALPAGSRGLDVGCGVGLYALWLAQAVGPDGRVLGIEPGEERVQAARQLAGAAAARGSSSGGVAPRSTRPPPPSTGSGAAMCSTTSRTPAARSRSSRACSVRVAGWS